MNYLLYITEKYEDWVEKGKPEGILLEELKNSELTKSNNSIKKHHHQ